MKVVRDKVVAYSQYHVDKAQSDVCRGMGLPMASYDGIVKISAASFEDLMGVFQDEEYNRVVVPDEQSFLKRDQAVMMIGYDEEKKVGGKVLVEI